MDNEVKNLIAFIPVSRKDYGMNLYNLYQNGDEKMFFRTMPRELTFEQFSNVFDSKIGVFMAVLYKEDLVGFITISALDTVAASCHFGIYLYPKYRDKWINKKHKLAFLLMYRVGEILFDEFGLNRMACHIIDDKQDLCDSLTKGGFRCEGWLEQSCKIDDEYKNEFTFALLKKDWERLYKSCRF